MNTAEQYLLLWLCNAMTLPESYLDERYYFDHRRKDFFYTIRATDHAAQFGILNRYDLCYAKELESDLAVRLEICEEIISGITEIPRIRVNEKIAIQLDFLSRQAIIFHGPRLISVIEAQTDDHCFVLDKLLEQGTGTTVLAPLWDEFKLQTTLAYISRFAQIVGITIGF